MYDMKKMNNLKHLDAGAPEPMKAFWALEKATFQNGALSEHIKQLIAVAVSLVTQCPYQGGARRRCDRCGACRDRCGCGCDACGRIDHPRHPHFRGLTKIAADASNAASYFIGSDEIAYEFNGCERFARASKP
jgi:hypothetical protein